MHIILYMHKYTGSFLLLSFFFSFSVFLGKNIVQVLVLDM